MIARVVYYICSETMGRFVGQCMGLGFFERLFDDAPFSEDGIPEPIQFYEEEEAEEFLDSWKGGRGDCFVEEGIG